MCDVAVDDWALGLSAEERHHFELTNFENSAANHFRFMHADQHLLQIVCLGFPETQLATSEARKQVARDDIQGSNSVV